MHLRAIAFEEALRRLADSNLFSDDGYQEYFCEFPDAFFDDAVAMKRALPLQPSLFEFATPRLQIELGHFAQTLNAELSL